MGRPAGGKDLLAAFAIALDDHRACLCRAICAVCMRLRLAVPLNVIFDVDKANICIALLILDKVLDLRFEVLLQGFKLGGIVALGKM